MKFGLQRVIVVLLCVTIISAGDDPKPSLTKQTTDAELDVLLAETASTSNTGSNPVAPFSTLADCLTPRSKPTALELFAKGDANHQLALNTVAARFRAPNAHRSKLHGSDEEQKGESAIQHKDMVALTQALITCFGDQTARLQENHDADVRASQDQFDKSARLAKCSFVTNFIFGAWGIAASIAAAHLSK